MKRSIYLLALVLFAVGCKPTPDPGLDDDLVTSTNSFQISIAPFPPKDLPAGANDTALVKFAWEELLALGWKSSINENNKRDYPDTTWYYSKGGAYPDLTVWETYAHRTELRANPDGNNNMLPFDSPPHYYFEQPVYPGDPNASFVLFNNLDENNEIGSCDVFAFVDSLDMQAMVLYQAKANRDEYQYVYDNFNSDTAKLISWRNNTIANISADSTYYPGASSTCNCPESEEVICLPCGGAPIPGDTTNTYQGAMEIKTAWRPLTQFDNQDDFFTREVIVYEERNDSIVYLNRTYVLIGIHIIHKTQNYQDFIFATWEHESVMQDNMGYILLDNDGNDMGSLVKNYPRLHDIPQVVTTANDSIHSQLSDSNSSSIWLKYHLIGVQATPSSDPNAFSFFLANYVIESDSTLANFQGSSIGDPHDQGINILYNGHGYSQGGCQGCHGVAQLTLGTDFSFLLDQVGKPVPAPDVDSLLPSGEAARLRAYIEATAQ